ncbi:MAG: flagellar hook protein FlgE [Candidatus Poribacteria bacterium]|nr:MAG: flagellar hook protein FlgE [Candidatus Poribacteria bacterium]
MITSFFSGLSGLRANQTKLDVIGNNIANANTVGFKASRVTFGDVLSRTIRSATPRQAPLQVGRGTQVVAISTVTRQGGLQETNNSSDLAIQGRGFFIVSNGERELYTRAGNFSINTNGELVTPDGLRLQGFNAVNGQIPVTAVKETLRLPLDPIPARATSQIGLSGNLSAAMPVGEALQTYTVTQDAAELAVTLAAGGISDLVIEETESANLLVEDAQGNRAVIAVSGTETRGDFQTKVAEAGLAATLPTDTLTITKLDPKNGISTTVELIDSLGTPHLATIAFYRTEDPSEWVWQMEIPDAIESVDLNSMRGMLVFDPNGAVTSFTNGDGADEWLITANVNPDADPLTLEMSRSVVERVTQYNLRSNLSVARNDGMLPGELTGFTVDERGVIIGNFSNGESRTLGQVLLADFVNPQGLMRGGSNTFVPTVNSGDPIVGIAGEGNMGVIVSGALELSNVDLAEEFIEMILAQRGIQSAANIITTGDTIMNDVLNLKR